MSTILDVTKVFQYGKTTIPARARRILGVKDGDSVVWMQDDGGRIVVVKQVEPEQSRFRIV